MINIIENTGINYNKHHPNLGFYIAEIEPCCRSIVFQRQEEVTESGNERFYLSFPYIHIFAAYSKINHCPEYTATYFFFGFSNQSYQKNPVVYDSGLPIARGMHICFGEVEVKNSQTEIIKATIARFFSNNFYSIFPTHPVLYSLYDWQEMTKINKNLILNVDWNSFHNGHMKVKNYSFNEIKDIHLEKSDANWKNMINACSPRDNEHYFKQSDRFVHYSYFLRNISSNFPYSQQRKEWEHVKQIKSTRNQFLKEYPQYENDFYKQNQIDQLLID